MQPIRVTILGDFWDMQIYSGRLYLWTMDADILVFDWDKVIASLTDDRNRLALSCAFTRGDLLYQRQEWELVFEDSDFRNLLTDKFSALSNMNIVLTLEDIESFCLSTQASPYRNLHDDCDILNNVLYSITEDGLFYANVHLPKKNKYKVDRKATKLWDGSGTAIRAGSGGRIALSAGDDGLFELESNQPRDIVHVSNRHTTFVNWSFASLYGSSDIAGGYMAGYYWSKELVHNTDNVFTLDEESDIDSLFGGSPIASPVSNQKIIRTFARTYDESQIFGRSIDKGKTHLSWGNQEKLYFANTNKLQIVNFTQQNLNHGNEELSPFEMLSTIDIEEQVSPVSGGTAYFGTVIESHSFILLCGSNGEQYNINGSAVRWRVYPRSKMYENHLHILYEDRLDIWSFNHDYFVNQKDKISGMKHRQSQKRRFTR